jgi:ATP-dependent DNA helicase DinG
MARAVERALDRDGVLLVEAGTGTGKTLAYLVPAILSGRKVVISTGTKTLQDQIMLRDLPLLEARLGTALSVACMKGLQNYLCLRRYDELRHGARSAEPAIARALPVLETWAGRTRTGDRGELVDLANGESVWSEVHSGSDTRIGPRCRHYDACFVTRMRKEAEDARVVVVNHHLFFADLALRGPHGAQVIPDYDAVIFDEAHLVEDTATDFFGVAVSRHRIDSFVRDAERALAAADLGVDAAKLLPAVVRTAQAFFAAMPRAAEAESGRLPLPPEAFDDRVRDPMLALDNALDAVASFARRHVERGESVAQAARRADLIRDDIATIAEGSRGGRVTWTSTRGSAVTIGASPVEVGGILRERLFHRGGAVVLTSATLAAGGSFEFVRSRLGIEGEVEERHLPAPFDYSRQAALYVPGNLPDPRDPGFFGRAVAEIRALVELTSGGAFVLCTSIRAMKALHGALRESLGRRVYLQGDAPNATLLERFRADGDAVLFATASFWQGVDVPGDALRLVVIDKLPFDVPTDPLVQARCARLEEAGEKPFMKYFVPAAALALKQGFGRLIRTRHDRGIVAVLDARITRRGYGRVFLASLPDARRCDTFDEVARFWHETQRDRTRDAPSLADADV